MMKGKSGLIVILFLSLFLFTLCQPCFSGMAPYDKGSFTTIEGKIKSIGTVDNKAVGEKGLHLIVATSTGEYFVHVCPQWYADQQQFQFMKGELVKISGSSFVRDNQNNIYAVSITRRFSSLPLEQQKQLACEVLSSSDLASIASKYKIELGEVEMIKARAEQYLNLALFPEEINLRNPETGDGLWGGRFYQENMPLIRQKRQEEIRQRIKERKGIN